MGRDEAMSRAVAGIGCRRSCPAADVIALVREAEARAGLHVTALAIPAAKAYEQGVVEAARQLGVTLLLVEAAALAAAQDRCVTRSACAERTLGVASVAEGCALAAAGPEGRLVLARIANARATCALAAPAQ
jgi:cobalt-precorrin 5A hydrolase